MLGISDGLDPWFIYSWLGAVVLCALAHLAQRRPALCFALSAVSIAAAIPPLMMQSLLAEFAIGMLPLVTLLTSSFGLLLSLAVSLVVLAADLRLIYRSLRHTSPAVK
jgi:hypothetical protein